MAAGLSMAPLSLTMFGVAVLAGIGAALNLSSLKERSMSTVSA
jgi:hypothetical protein